jgi:MSHA biogenesis protein MshO
MMRTPHHIRGFTLIEVIMVIVITGIIGGMVAVFIKRPVDAYLDSARRAALTDVADTAVRRMSRDIRKALPNSINVPNNQCIEFIPTKTGGRYRADDTAVGLNFNAADTSFNMLGSSAALPADQRIASGDIIAVYNLGITGSNAYNQDNTSAVTATPTESAAPIETTITINSKLFPLASGSNRFHVIPFAENVVTYVCSGFNLIRTTMTFANAATAGSTCPTSGALVSSSAILANNLSTVNPCTFTYNGSDLQRNALVRLQLNLTSSGETVSLYHEVHVNNTP